jgi:23S rRNA pseudouridine2605 synthase/16S rRNA pseudouridine516 synthase
MASHRKSRPKGTRGDWLSRALGRAGVLTPRETEAAARDGRITIDGVPATDHLSAVEATSRVELDGRPVSLHFETRVLAYHKPPGIIVAGTDAEGQGTVFEALQRELPETLQHYTWHAIGRLDRATSGLLLFTNDERVVQHVTAPETHLSKRYVAKTGERVRETHVEQLVAGVRIDDGEACAASAAIRAPNQIEIVLTEGRYHQVRRMLNAVRLTVVSLHREAIGQLKLDVEKGHWRELSKGEIESGLGFSAEPAPSS